MALTVKNEDLALVDVYLICGLNNLNYDLASFRFTDSQI